MRLPNVLPVALMAAAIVGCGPQDEIAQDSSFHREGPALAYDSYEVLFTNPTCAEYPYDREVVSVSGDPLTAKPRDVFCTKRDLEASAARAESPQNKLIEWISSDDTEAIFFTALSFSNADVQQALCTAVEERNVKIRFVLDRNTGKSKAEALLACEPASGDPDDAPEMVLRGHVGSLGVHHNKLFIINPESEHPKIAFGSGNVSSGLVLHHENWHFIQVPAESYFAQMHQCLMEGVLEHGHSKTAYREFIEGCRDAIDAVEEGDMKIMLVPGEGARASQYIRDAVARADAIDIAAHRFSHSTLLKALRKRLSDDPETPVRFIADDDLYWAKSTGAEVGPNTLLEGDRVEELEGLGMQSRWMETNHSLHLLHHNKIFLFDMPEDEQDTVFCGAGNFTKTAFTDNFENFYYVAIPEVVERMQAQYEHLWSDLATPAEDMPSENILPPNDPE